MDKQTTLELFNEVDALIDPSDEEMANEFLIDLQIEDEIVEDITINTEDFEAGVETLIINETNFFEDINLIDEGVFVDFSEDDELENQDSFTYHDETIDTTNNLVENMSIEEDLDEKTIVVDKALDKELVTNETYEIEEDIIVVEETIEIEEDVIIVEEPVETEEELESYSTEKQEFPKENNVDIIVDIEDGKKGICKAVETSELNTLLNNFNIIDNKESDEVAIKVEEELVVPTTEEFGQVNILVIGVGGCGCNVINRMYTERNEKIKLIAMDTSSQSLEAISSDYKLLIGETQFKGHGSGGNTETCEVAFNEAKDKIKEILKGVDMLFLAGGIGRGTGSVGLINIGHIAKELGILTIGFATLPRKMEANIPTLEKYFPQFNDAVDSTIIIENERIGRIAKTATMMEAMRIADSMLVDGIKGVFELITKPGKINLDYADIKTAFLDQGSSVMGIGFGKGDNPVVSAIENAFTSEIIDFDSIKTSKTIIFNITCSERTITIDQASKGTELLYSMGSGDNINLLLFGYSYDNSLGDEVKVTFIATGTSSMEYDFNKSLMSIGSGNTITQVGGGLSENFFDINLGNEIKLKVNEDNDEKEVEEIKASRPNFFK
ncbi:MAG: cell division FtsZ family protein [Spiroplasma sp.]|nr:cell division FtsZ family protein [Mycoplasmatales bacterium]